MEQEYHVTCTLTVSTNNPVTAAREAYDRLRFSRSRPTRFEVRYRYPGTELEVRQPIELDRENPLNRPAVTIEDDSVLCGHCGSEKTNFVEDVGQYAPMSLKNGRPTSWGGDLEVDEVGDDPRVLCFGCGRESDLPPDFTWAEEG